eukprot:Em0015g1284a
MKFLAVGELLHLDGFVFELPGDDFGQDVHKFGQGVRRILKCISDHDPSGYHCMNKSFLDKIPSLSPPVMPRPAFNNPVTFMAGRLDINGHVHGQRWTV